MIPFILAAIVSLMPLTEAHAASAIDGLIEGPEIEIFVMAGESAPRQGQPAAQDRVEAAAVATSTNITIEYNTDCLGPTAPWPTEARASLEAAALVWEGLVHSAAEIVVVACWRTDLADGTLGSASTRTFDGGFFNLPVPGVFYPNALANAIIAQDPFPTFPEMRANFNANTDWHFDATTQPPAAEFDLTTVAIRNIAHGLGFAGISTIDDEGLGYTGFIAFPLPSIFDRFTVDGQGNSITSFTNGTEALGDVLQGSNGSLFFDGPRANAANGGNPVALNTPSTWDENASHDFLAASFDGTADDLMTHTLNPGEQFLTPGPITLGVLHDIGWPQSSRSEMTEALGSFSYNPVPVVDGALGTLIISFTFTYNSSTPLTAVQLQVNTANNAKLQPSYTPARDSFIGDGGVGTIMHVPNAELPDDNGTPTVFNQGETLSVPFQIIIDSAPWGINFDMYASDDSLSAAGREPVLSFSVDSSMFDFDAPQVEPVLFLPLIGQ